MSASQLKTTELPTSATGDEIKLPEQVPISLFEKQSRENSSEIKLTTSFAPSQASKLRVRHSKKDEGVFETGLDVIEQEYELVEDAQGNLQQIRLLYQDGKLTD